MSLPREIGIHLGNIVGACGGTLAVSALFRAHINEAVSRSVTPPTLNIGKTWPRDLCVNEI